MTECSGDLKNHCPATALGLILHHIQSKSMPEPGEAWGEQNLLIQDLIRAELSYHAKASPSLDKVYLPSIQKQVDDLRDTFTSSYDEISLVQLEQAIVSIRQIDSQRYQLSETLWGPENELLRSNGIDTLDLESRWDSLDRESVVLNIMLRIMVCLSSASEVGHI